MLDNGRRLAELVEELLELSRLEARHLLQQNACQTLSELAYAVGFDTPGYFTKVFKNISACRNTCRRLILNLNPMPVRAF